MVSLLNLVWLSFRVRTGTRNEALFMGQRIVINTIWRRFWGRCRKEKSKVKNVLGVVESCGEVLCWDGMEGRRLGEERGEGVPVSIS